MVLIVCSVLVAIVLIFIFVLTIGQKLEYVVEFIPFTLLSVIIGLGFFAIFAPNFHQITTEEYLSAVGAKIIIESGKADSELMSNCYKIITEYNKERNEIQSNYNNDWDGVFYDINSVKKYPEIKIN